MRKVLDSGAGAGYKLRACAIGSERNTDTCIYTRKNLLAPPGLRRHCRLRREKLSRKLASKRTRPAVPHPRRERFSGILRVLSVLIRADALIFL
jgi:hypothetical protein